MTSVDSEHLKYLRNLGHDETIGVFYAGTCGRDWRLVSVEDDWNWMLDKIEDLERRLDEAQLRSIEASNPGIDIEEVKRIRRGEGWSA